MKNNSEKNFDCLVALGDSWTWGAELPEDKQKELCWPTGLSKQLGLDCVNLAVPGSSNFCKKWNLFDWIYNNTQYKNPLVIVGLTDPGRQLLYDNSKEFFQEADGHLISENLVESNWKNSKPAGGFARHYANNTTGWSTLTKEEIQKFFYKHMYNDTVGEINSIWEIQLLNGLIKDIGGTAVFWSNFYRYRQVFMPWAKKLLEHCHLVNDLAPFSELVAAHGEIDWHSKYFAGCQAHPNAEGHGVIQKTLYTYLNNNNLI
jgi:hypothetical protein